MTRNPPTPVRRWIINADDFGRSAEINAAVQTAHRDGVLTSASLMVAEKFVDSALTVARENPRLAVGLHLALADGASMTRGAGPLSDATGQFMRDPTRAGMRYYFDRSLRSALESEIGAQVEAFRSTGLRLDHVNGHVNIHLHPVVIDILLANAARWGVRAIRLTRDPFWMNAGLARGAWLFRASHAFIYWLLCARVRRRFQAAGIAFAPRVFGLLQYARMDEAYWLKLVATERSPLVEVYAHPSTTAFAHELAALTSPRVRGALESAGIQRICHGDL